ncbi:hypothetical protein [Propionispora sp. 2/2-37]|uniref:hypothetical protein n=1 Tax=Propionispora sp. 2/2-37 TaxID=1677858 RepID=UPI0006BB7F5F|nr:hypothetical protein [Propionispora sp. 2/2-37]
MVILLAWPAPLLLTVTTLIVAMVAVKTIHAFRRNTFCTGLTGIFQPLWAHVITARVVVLS